MKLDKNHIVYQTSNEIRKLVKPLAQLEDIHHFCYSVDYSDGSGFCLDTSPDHYDVVLENEFPLPGFYFDKDWHTWKGNLPEAQILEFKKLNISHGVSHVIKSEDKTEIFEFATHPENDRMYEFCLNNRHILKKFMAYFINEAQDIIEAAHHERFIPPLHMREKNHSFKTMAPKKELSPEGQVLIDYPFNLLSPMESNCFQLLLNGHTNTDISKMFNLSSKTIDSYVARIKYKLNSRSKVELIQMAKKIGIVEHYFN